jgi:hypothetical protein
VSSPGFILFVVCTGVLFVRPTEIVEALVDAPLYEFSIIGCFVCAFPSVFAQLTWRSLRTNPTTFCVVGMLAAVALSPLSRLSFGEAASDSFAFFKPVLSYLLLIAVLRTTGDLTSYLKWVLAFICCLTALALFQHYGIIDNAALAAVRDQVRDEESGDLVAVMRLCGAGIFGNPNDLARILVVGIVLCLWLADGASILFKPVWFAVLGVLGYALVLTMSRGGLIALVVSLLVLAVFRLGARRALLVASLGLPVLALTIGGRQIDLSTSEGTGQQRIQLWSDGLAVMAESPVFGCGMIKFNEMTNGLGTHNSFVNGYVELGFLGGTLFLGAVFCPLWAGVQQIRRGRVWDPQLRRLAPYLIAILAGYAAGMISSNRCFAIPTYLLLGLVVVYLRLSRADLTLPGFRVTPRHAVRLGVLSAVTLVGIKVFVMASVSFDVKF